MLALRSRIMVGSLAGAIVCVACAAAPPPVTFSSAGDTALISRAEAHRRWTRQGVLRADYTEVIAVDAILISPEWQRTVAHARAQAFGADSTGSDTGTSAGTSSGPPSADEGAAVEGAPLAAAPAGASPAAPAGASPAVPAGADPVAPAAKPAPTHSVRVALVVTTWDRRENDLDRGALAAWQVALVDNNGLRYAPVRITRDRRPEAHLHADYPTMRDFAVVYHAEFNTATPVFTASTKHVRVVVHSARGAVTLDWHAAQH